MPRHTTVHFLNYGFLAICKEAIPHSRRSGSGANRPLYSALEIRGSFAGGDGFDAFGDQKASPLESHNEFDPLHGMRGANKNVICFLQKPPGLQISRQYIES
jgi:hypothetical protein